MTKTKKMTAMTDVNDKIQSVDESPKKPKKNLMTQRFKARKNQTPVSHMVFNALLANNNTDGVPLARIREFIRIQYNNHKRPGKYLQLLIKEYMTEEFNKGTIFMVNSDGEKINFTKRFGIEMEDDGGPDE